MSSPLPSQPDMSPQPNGHSPTPIHSKTSQACNRCRRRKTKCTGDRPCRTCNLGDYECVYPEVERKILVSENYLADLEARIRRYEAAESARVSGITAYVTSQTDMQPAPENKIAHEEFQNPLVDGFTQLVLSPSGQPQYCGNSSSTSLSLRFRDFVKASRSTDDCDISVEYPTYDPAAWPKFRPSMSKIPQLPPYAIAHRLYNAQDMFIGSIFSFVPPHVFEQRLLQVYSGTLDFSDCESCLTYCQILVIFAFGQMYSINQWTGHDGPPGFSYFMQSLKFLPDIHEEGSVLFVEVLSLIGYFMQILNRRDAAFLYIGLALRMAMSLGLHQELSDPSLSEVEKEHRRRLWWSVYSMDRILCCKSGNPITIADEDIGVALPKRIPDLELETSSATVLFHYTELSRILGTISNGIYRKSPKSGSTLVASVQTVMSDLAKWLRDLPPQLRLDSSKLDKNVSRQQVSMFLHYYQCINMTARPLIFHVVQKHLQKQLASEKELEWRTGLSPTTIAVIEACITAARESTTIVAAAAKQNLFATYGYMDGEHAYSAAIVLVMINIAFPRNTRDNASMDTALGVLCEMAEKGNGHIRARYNLLLNLKSMIKKEAPVAASTPASDPAASTFSSFNSSEAAPSIPQKFQADDSELWQSTASTHQDWSMSASFPSIDAQDSEALDEIFSFENTIGDVGLWEECYGNIDMDMDFAWTHLNDTARGNA